MLGTGWWRGACTYSTGKARLGLTTSGIVFPLSVLPVPRRIMMRALILVGLVLYAAAVPMKLYEKTNGEKYKQVLVPVASTVIPLDDLPVYQVGVGFGLTVTPAPGIRKPDEPPKLITIKSKKKNKKDNDAALIEEVTKEEYQKLIREE